MTQIKDDLKAIADALRRHDRFLVATHENPDGDALGSLLAATLTLRALGKDAVMYLAGDTPLPHEYAFMPLDELLRDLPADTAVSAACTEGLLKRGLSRVPSAVGRNHVLDTEVAQGADRRLDPRGVCVHQVEAADRPIDLPQQLGACALDEPLHARMGAAADHGREVVDSDNQCVLWRLAVEHPGRRQTRPELLRVGADNDELAAEGTEVVHQMLGETLVDHERRGGVQLQHGVQAAHVVPVGMGEKDQIHGLRGEVQGGHVTEQHPPVTARIEQDGPPGRPDERSEPPQASQPRKPGVIVK